MTSAYSTTHSLCVFFIRIELMLDRLKMPSAYTPSQKGAIAQFTSVTAAKDSVAAKVIPLFRVHFSTFQQWGSRTLTFHCSCAKFWCARRSDWLTRWCNVALEGSCLERRPRCRCVRIWYFLTSTFAFALLFAWDTRWKYIITPNIWRTGPRSKDEASYLDYRP